MALYPEKDNLERFFKSPFGLLSNFPLFSKTTLICCQLWEYLDGTVMYISSVLSKLFTELRMILVGSQGA